MDAVNQRSLIKEFFWPLDKADSGDHDSGPQTSYDPHTCLVTLHPDVSEHSGYTHTKHTEGQNCLTNLRGSAHVWLHADNAYLNKCGKKNNLGNKSMQDSQVGKCILSIKNRE